MIDNEKDVPYLAHENAMARLERSNRRAWSVVLFLIIALLVTNFGWIFYATKYQGATKDINIQANGDVTEVGNGE